jgi:hypothetical protein
VFSSYRLGAIAMAGNQGTGDVMWVFHPPPPLADPWPTPGPASGLPAQISPD